MNPVLFRCPVSGDVVQGLIAESGADDKSSRYELVTCASCARVHFVNREGRLLGERRDEE